LTVAALTSAAASTRCRVNLAAYDSLRSPGEEYDS
jgi:hypothetical protein